MASSPLPQAAATPSLAAPLSNLNQQLQAESSARVAAEGTAQSLSLALQEKQLQVRPALVFWVCVRALDCVCIVRLVDEGAS